MSGWSSFSSIGYRQGILAGFEVASPMCLVSVAQDYIQLPEPGTEQVVTYEYRNVAVSPTVPSITQSGG